MQKKIIPNAEIRTPLIDKKGAFIQIKKRIKYSDDGYTIRILEAGQYESDKLPEIVLKLHKKGII